PAEGFQGTKFPTPPRLLLLEEEAARTGSKSAAKMLDVTLDRMARGGIYDHLGGGFHRYSTERTWTVPHFEKMLYDNAQLVKVYRLDGPPNFEEKYRILTLPEPLAKRAKELNLSEEKLLARLGPLKQKFLAERARRPRPFLDTKVLTAWNGQMVAGYAVAGQERGEKGYRD